MLFRERWPRYRQSPAVEQGQLYKMINELANIDSRITYTRKSYNDLCLQFNRSDLLFGKGANGFSP